VALQPRVIDANVYTMLREVRRAFEKVNNKGSIVLIPPKTPNETARRARYANWASIR